MNRWAAISVLIAILLLAACGDSTSIDSSDKTNNQWDEMNWDEGRWQ